jgi:hypothetical protein
VDPLPTGRDLQKSAVLGVLKYPPLKGASSSTKQDIANTCVWEGVRRGCRHHR